MLSVNKAIVVGEVGDAPKHSNGDGWSVARFSVKTVKTFTKGDGSPGMATTWVRCTAWNALADKMHAGIPKGTLVAVSGSIESRKYTDKDKIERREFSIKADSIEIMSYAGEEPTLKSQPTIKPSPAPEKFNDDHLAF